MIRSTHEPVLSPARLQTLMISVDDMRCIVEQVGLDTLMDEMIKRLFEAFQSFDSTETIIPVRTGFSYDVPHLGLVEWMPLFQRHHQIIVKAVGYHPRNPNRYGLPTILSTMSAYDITSGHLTVMMDGTFLTALRTGAASAIASQLMATPNSQVLGLIGCGAQAVTQLHALSRCFELERVLIFDVDPAIGQSFSERVACLQLQPLKIQPVAAADLVASADMICTATSVEVGKGPVFSERSLKPWVHVNALGADFPGKFEIPLSLLKRSFVCTDFRDQAISEGECQQLADLSQIGAELFQVVQQPKQYLHLQTTPTVFDSTGFALEDQVAMNMLLEYAADLRVGTWINLESASADERNPYSFVTEYKQKLPGLQQQSCELQAILD